MIDAAHTVRPIVDTVGLRNVVAVVVTHGHNDHVTVAPDLGVVLHAPVLLHPGDDMLWKATHPEERYWSLENCPRIAFAGTELVAIHTPGHSPGSVCLYLPEAQALFSGDTLFSGGPGATGRSYSDFPTIIDSIRDRVLTLPEHTLVYTGHGANTIVSAEPPHLAEWIARGC